MWDLPGLGLEPVSHELAGGLVTTTPPGKPLQGCLNVEEGEGRLEPPPHLPPQKKNPVTCFAE